jgi:transposase InsO family protein
MEQKIVPLVKEKKAILQKEGGKKLYFRLKPEFIKLNIKIGRDKFLNLLRVNGLLQKKKKFKMPGTDSNHPFRKHKNLIKGAKIFKPDQVYVSDITYIKVNGQWNYLTLIMDLFSRKIMGYNFADGMKVNQTTLPAMEMALKNRKSKSQTILHSDRGLQYCNPKFVSANAKKNITPSMTNNGDPYENAAAERLNGILKYEFNLKESFPSFDMAKKHVDEAVNLYNQYRTHWRLNLKTPDFVYNNPQLFKTNIVTCY